MEKRVFTKDMASIKTAEVIECPDCAFEFSVIHEQSETNGLYSCPNCQEDNLEADNYHLKEENKRLREALEFYAEQENWKRHNTSEPYSLDGGYEAPTWEPSAIEFDEGKVAHQALQGGKIK
ncbi:hypothetical protein ACIQZG_08585 [Lysinibacillus sp. NPDC096418]|uniref:hypothetical protein n=1 Tax=Lysinibacillus sp. NPDC096418 TaxID=3364138 RepID=UPI0037F81696